MKRQKTSPPSNTTTNEKMNDNQKNRTVNATTLEQLLTDHDIQLNYHVNRKETPSTTTEVRIQFPDIIEEDTYYTSQIQHQSIESENHITDSLSVKDCLENTELKNNDHVNKSVNNDIASSDARSEIKTESIPSETKSNLTSTSTIQEEQLPSEIKTSGENEVAIQPSTRVLSGILLQNSTESNSEMFLIPERTNFPVQTSLLGSFLMRNQGKQVNIHFFVITSHSGQRFYVYTLNLYESTLALVSTYKFHNTFQRLLIYIAESGMKTIDRQFVEFLWKEFSKNVNQESYRKTGELFSGANSLSTNHGDEVYRQCLWIDLRRFQEEKLHSQSPKNNSSNTNLQVEKCSEKDSAQFQFKQEFPLLFCLLQSPKTYPPCESDFRILVSSLSPQNLVSIVEFILSEQQIIFCSRYFRKIAESMESLLALVYPFDWPYVYIPMLPSNLFDFLSAPCPYLIGVNMSYEEFMKVTKNADFSIIVDLDSDIIFRESRLTNQFTSLSCKQKKVKQGTLPNMRSRNGDLADNHDIDFAFPPHIHKYLLEQLTKFYIQSSKQVPTKVYSTLQPRILTTEDAEDEYLRNNTWESSDDEDDPLEQEINANLPSSDSFFSSSTLFRNAVIKDDEYVIQIDDENMKLILEYHPLKDENSWHQTPFVCERTPSGFNELRKTFLKVFLNLFKSYRLYLKHSNNQPIHTQLPFDVNRFIEENVTSESATMIAFYTTFFKTQIFNFFIQSRYTLPKCLDIFDAKASGKMERFAINLSLLAERTHSGFMWKLGRVRRSWKYRYFSLQGNLLRYFTDNTQSRQKGSIEIIPGESSLYIPRQIEKHKTKYAFILRTRDRTLLCCLESQTALNEWCRIIQAKSMKIAYRESIENMYTRKNLFFQGDGYEDNFVEKTLMLRQEPWISYMRSKLQQA